MDWSYARISTSKNTNINLHREIEIKFHVENPKNPSNEFVLLQIILETMLSYLTSSLR